MNIVFEKTLCFTGHRPDKLYGYNYKTEGNRLLLLKLRSIIEMYINRRGINTFISGMALGIDIWSAQIILALKKKYPHIKLVCAIPCDEQWKKWKDQDIETWHKVVEQADYVHYVSEEPYTAWCMNARNRWMVDNSSYVIGVWDGTTGGTYDCLKYAVKRDRSIMHLDSTNLEKKILKSVDNPKK
uniref:DprA-like DNA processing chain A n=1 Tax=Bacillus phage KoopaTroopa TaxID=3234046 RepID=A0AB39C751_9CAUD